jgi:putative transposase
MTPGARERAFREKRRLRAAELFERGVANVLIAEALGVSDSAVDLWKARWEEGGAEALRSSGCPGYPALLDEQQVAVLVTELDRGALAHGHGQDRWMLKWVNDLIEELFGVRFADTAGVWRLLRRIGYSHHRPGRRAIQRDQQAISAWREVTWPRIREQAGRTGAWIVCEDEAGAMLTPPIRGTWARRGRRVVLRCSYAHERKVSMAAFACYRPGRLPRLFYALAPNASFTEDEFGPLLTDLHARLGPAKVILVWDRLSAHVTSRKTRAFLDANASWLTVEPLPGYAPELNPVEQAWAWIKNGPLANYCAANITELTGTAGRALERLRKQPELLTPFLRHTGLDWM